MDATKGVEFLLTQGVLGVLVVFLGWALYRKDKELAECRDARVKDALTLAGAAEKASAALTLNSAVIERRSQTSEEMTRVVLEQSRQTERATDRILAKLDEFGRDGRRP